MCDNNANRIIPRIADASAYVLVIIESHRQPQRDACKRVCEKNKYWAGMMGPVNSAVTASSQPTLGPAKRALQVTVTKSHRDKRRSEFRSLDLIARLFFPSLVTHRVRVYRVYEERKCAILRQKLGSPFSEDINFLLLYRCFEYLRFNDHASIYARVALHAEIVQYRLFARTSFTLQV